MSWNGLEVLERISAGSFGTVYRAWDSALEREVALKLYPRRYSNPNGSRVVREARLLARLKHENIVTVYGAGEHDGQVGIWMELARGRSLGDVVEGNGPLSAREAALIGLEICQALAAVHAIGVLHRDVKAQNVIREAGGRIILIDFGLGEERRSQAEQAKELAGTPLYMAPELLNGEAASVQTEIYALGVLLFYLTTGRYPVVADTLEDLRQAHRNDARRLLRELRPGLAQDFIGLVERATSSSPAERFRSAAEFTAALQTMVGAAPARSTSKRPSARMVGSIAAILVASGGIYWWLVHPTHGLHPEVWITDTIVPANQQDYLGLTIALREQVAQSEFIRIFDSGTIPEFLDRMAISRATRLTGRLRRELAQRAGISYIVDSTVLQVGAELRLKVAVESIGPISFVAAQRAEREFSFDDSTSVSAAVATAAAWVRETAREPLIGIGLSNNAEITTNSLSALAHFVQGERWNTSGAALRAIAEWQAAVESDPAFLQAHMRLGDVLRTNGRAMESLEEYAAAYHLLDKRTLGLRESFRIRSAFLFDSGDVMAADAIHAEWAARFPDDAEPFMKRGRPLLYSGRPQEAVAALRRAEVLNPDSTSVAGLLVLCHITLGDWASAAEDTKRLRALQWEDRAELFDAVTAFLQGRSVEALRRTLAVRDRNMNDASRSELRIGATLEAVSILSEVGRDQKAIGLLESDLSLAHRMGQPADLAREELALATIRNADGDRAGAREAATAALDLEPGSDILRAAGPLLVVAGGQEAATARMHAFDAKVPLGEARTWRVTRIPHLMIEGELLLARGQARAGVRKLREAADIEEPGEPHAVLAEALESTGDRESALEEWLRIVESYRLLWASAQYAPPAGLGRRALERAVKLCQLSGNSAGTEARCERARQRLASLRTISVPN